MSRNIKDYYKHPSLIQKQAQVNSNNQQRNHFSNPQDQTQTKNSIKNPFAQNKETELPKNKTLTQQTPMPYNNKTIKKFPRPLINSDESRKNFEHCTENNFEQPPNIIYNYISKGNSNATIRHAHSSVYLVPDNSSNMGKSQIKISIVFNPLAEGQEEDQQIPYSDKRQQQILRCQRCGTFVNPFFSYTNQYTKYTCNICDFTGETPQNFFEDSQKDGFQESFNAVYDLIVPDNYKLNDYSQNNVLLCFDLSLQSISNGSFNHILNSTRNLLEYLDEETYLGIVIYDSQLSFLRIDEEDYEVSILRGIDQQAPVCPLSFSELFFNVSKQIDTIKQLLDYVENLATEMYTNNALELQNSPHDLEIVGKTLESIFERKGGRVIIFASIHKQKSNDIVKYETKEKTQIKQKNNIFYDIGNSLAQKSVTVDLFITTEFNIELSTISQLSIQTSGNVYFYPEFKIYEHSDKIYFDLYRNLTVSRGFDVACRLRTSLGLQTLHYLTPRGKIHTLDFRLPQLNADQNIGACLALGENLKNRKKVFLQFVTLYSNSCDTRLIRIINLSLNVTNDMQLFYKNMDQHGFSYHFIHKYLWELMNKEQNEVNEQIIKECVKLFKYYRYEVGGRYDPKEFALAEKLSYFPLYIYSAMTQDCFNIKSVKNPDLIFNTFLTLKQLPFQNLFYYLYPKIFDLKIMFNDWKEQSDTYLPGTQQENEQICLPNSAPSNISIADDKDGALLIDNGLYLTVFIMSQIDQELLGHLFGVSTIEEIQEFNNIPEIESDYNQRVQNILNRLREIKLNGSQQLRVIIEGQSQCDLQSLFIESNRTTKNSDYWDFLSQLHEKVKDD